MVINYYFTKFVIYFNGFRFNKQKGKYIIMENLITLENVSKTYGNKCVLDNINLKIVRGQNLAIIGDNGTGKSTLLRIIAGLSGLSSGKRILCTNGDKLKIGYVPDRFPKLNFTPYEYIYYMGKIEGFSQTYIDKCSSELFQTFNINLMKDTRIKYLSKGTIQKVAVIQAFMSKPDILLLDEPLSGQDNKSQKKFIEILQKFKTEESCIVLACHEMNLVDKLTDEVITIEDGKIISNIHNKDNDYENMLIRFKTCEGFDANMIKKFNGLLNIVENEQLVSVLINKHYSDIAISKLLQMGCSIVSVNEDNL